MVDDTPTADAVTATLRSALLVPHVAFALHAIGTALVAFEILATTLGIGVVAASAGEAALHRATRALLRSVWLDLGQGSGSGSASGWRKAYPSCALQVARPNAT